MTAFRMRRCRFHFRRPKGPAGCRFPFVGRRSLRTSSRLRRTPTIRIGLAADRRAVSALPERSSVAGSIGRFGTRPPARRRSPQGSEKFPLADRDIPVHVSSSRKGSRGTLRFSASRPDRIADAAGKIAHARRLVRLAAGGTAQVAGNRRRRLGPAGRSAGTRRMDRLVPPDPVRRRNRSGASVQGIRFAGQGLSGGERPVVGGCRSRVQHARHRAGSFRRFLRCGPSGIRPGI